MPDLGAGRDERPLTEPPSLREFLAAGCHLADVPDIRLPLLFDLIDEPPETAPKWVAWYRDNVAAWLAGEPDWLDGIAAEDGQPQPRREHTQGEICRWSWAAEALEDPGLARAIRRAAGR